MCWLFYAPVFPFDVKTITVPSSCGGIGLLSGLLLTFLAPWGDEALYLKAPHGIGPAEALVVEPNPQLLHLVVIIIVVHHVIVRVIIAKNVGAVDLCPTEVPLIQIPDKGVKLATREILGKDLGGESLRVENYRGPVIRHSRYGAGYATVGFLVLAFQ